MKVTYKLVYWLMLALIAQIKPAHSADTKKAEEIMKQATQAFYYQGKDQVSTIKMTIVDKQGRQRKRELVMLRKNMGEGQGEQKYYAYFNFPTDIKKMVFMAWKNIQSEDDRWLYLPALDLVKRIAASDVRTSFVGSDFYYEDVSGRSVSVDEHLLIAEDKQYFTVKSTPKDPSKVKFKNYITKIDKKNNIPMLVEYYDHQDKIYRRYKTLEIESIEGFDTIVKNEMANLLNDNKTTVEYLNVKYSQDIPERIFSERYLRRKPKGYVQ